MKNFLAVVLCVALFGCRPIYDDNGNEIGYDEKKAEYKWGEWGDPKFISIANDSLAILVIYKPYYKEWIECGWSGCYTDRETTNYRIGLFLVNYREKQKTVWGDTLEYNMTIVEEYFQDSSVLVYDRKHNKFGFWKIGTMEVEFIDYIDYSGKTSWKYVSYNARPFPNGNILLLETFNSKYPKFLLEPKDGQLKQFEFSEESEWLSNCTNGLKKDHYYVYDYVNVSCIGGELSCIRGNETHFELTVNNIVLDTSSLNKSFVERITGWYGNYVRDASNKIYKIDTLNFIFDSTYAPMRLLINGPSFYNGDGSVSYTTQDLLDIYE